MGVKGLWQLLQPTGHPVTLESLEGKVLAVDVSIWLNQTIKGMRDKDGNPLPNAHLLGLFHRVCKLLFYGIKPIFVFDGGVPVLKKQTLIARRQRKEFASNKSERASKDILENLLKHHALNAVLGTPGGRTAAPAPSTSQQQKPDLFELPPLPVPLEQHQVVDEELSWEQRMDQRSIIHAEFQNLEDVDIHSDDFKDLPPEIQHEILTDLKESNRLNCWARLHEMPKESNDFSKFQLERLKKRNVLSQRLDDVRKEITVRNSGEIAHILTGSQAAGVVESRKLASDDTSHYILIKGISKVRAEEERMKLEQGSATLGGAGANNEDTERKDTEKKILELTKEGRDIVDILKSEKELKKKAEERESLKSSNIANKQEDKKDYVQFDEADKPSTCSSNVKHEIVEPTSSVEDVVTIDDNADDSKDSDIALDSKNHNATTASKGETAQPKKEVIIESSDEDCEIVQVLDKETGEVSSIGDDEMAGGFIIEDSDNETEENCEAPIESLIVESVHKDHRKKELIINDHSTAVTSSHSETSFTMKEISENQKSPSENSTDAEKTVQKSPSENSMELRAIVENAPKLKDGSLADVTGKKILQNLPINASNSPSNFEMTKVPAEAVDDSSSDGEDFIEIKINPEAAKEDELFPASIFMTNDVPPQQMLQTADQILRDVSKDSGLNIVEAEDAISIPEDVEQEEKVEVASKQDDIIMPDDLQVVNDANEFEGLSREEMVELQTVLMSESSQLNQERGRQQRMASSVTEQMTLEAQDLLHLFGVPFIISPMEAEAQCAYLDLTNQTQGSVTDDSDIWLFGGLRVYKNFFNQNKHVEFYKLEDVSRQLFLDKEKMISLAMICGSDYTEGIEGLGPVHGMEILQEFQGEGMESLRNFKKWWDGTRKQLMPPVETKLKGRLRKVVLGEGFPSQEVFNAYLDPAVDKSTDTFSWGKPDLDLLRQFSKHKFGWNKEKSDEVLLPVMKQVNSGHTQKHITSFFLPTQLETEPRALKSRRVKRVLKRLRNPDEPEQMESPVKKNSQNEAQKRTQKEAPKKSQKEVQNGRGKRGRGRGQTRGMGRGRGNASTSARNTVELSESSSDDEDNAKTANSGVVNLSESDSDSDDISEGTASSATKGKAPPKQIKSSRGRSSNRAKRK